MSERDMEKVSGLPNFGCLAIAGKPISAVTGQLAMQCKDCELMWSGAADSRCWLCESIGTRIPMAHEKP